MSVFLAAEEFQPAPDKSLLVSTGEGLTLRATIDPHSPLLRQFFELYDSAFILPSEKEEFSGFVDCLALNAGPGYATLAGRYGPYRELVILASASDSKGPPRVVGGANLICFPLARSGQHGREIVLAGNLNYLFVVDELRGRGWSRRILAGCETMIRRSFLSIAGAPADVAALPRVASRLASAPLYLFLEQNDPLRLSAEQYALDSAHAGIDQLDRLRVWARLGAKLLDFPYVQPALSEGQEADHGLALALLAPAGDALDACLLQAHLERFFAISVRKGKALASSQPAEQQLARCSSDCAAARPIRLLDPLPWLDAMRGQALPAGRNAGASLVDELRAFANAPQIANQPPRAGEP